jgi:hypothetical protein
VLLLLLLLLRTATDAAVQVFEHDRHLPPEIVHDERVEAHYDRNVIHELRMTDEYPRQGRAGIHVPGLDLHDHLRIASDGRGRSEDVE